MENDEQRSRFSSKLDDLKTLLERQVKLAQQGNITDVETLSRQADSLVQEIVQTGMLDRAELKNQFEQLRKLYEDLSLAIMAQKADVFEKLSRVRKGRKTIGTYHNSI
jgi:hypothetical protein